MTPSPESPRIRITPYIIIGICLYFIYQYFLTHKNEFNLIAHLNFQHITVITTLLLINNYLISLKLFYLLKLQGLNNVGQGEWFKTFAVSRFINFHIPQGANLYRMIKLKKDHLFPLTQSIGFTVLSSWLELILTLLFAYILLWTLKPQYSSSFFHSAQISIILTALVLFLSPYCFKIFFREIKLASPLLQRIQNKSLELLNSFTLIQKSPQILFFFFLITLTTFCLYSFAIFASFEAIQTPLSLPHSIIFTVVLLLSRSFNIVPGNLGISELICGYISEFLNVPTGSGILVSGIIRVLEYIFLFILTLFFYKKEQGINK